MFIRALAFTVALASAERDTDIKPVPVFGGVEADIAAIPICAQTTCKYSTYTNKWGKQSTRTLVFGHGPENEKFHCEKEGRGCVCRCQDNLYCSIKHDGQVFNHCEATTPYPTPAPTPAPIDCEGSWSEWNTCSTSCESGTHSRSYTVNSNAVHGGADCEAVTGASESQACDLGSCPIHCDGAWTDYGACDMTCGDGSKTKTFQIATDADFGGIACEAVQDQEETTSCKDIECPVHCKGTWGTGWSDCDKTCGNGLHSRTFKITRPLAHEGDTCEHPHNHYQEQQCNNGPCPVDCVGAWGDWGACDLTCNDAGSQGFKFRKFRHSTFKAHGGAACETTHMHEESQACGQPCLDIQYKTCPATVKDASCTCDNGYKVVGGGCISRHATVTGAGNNAAVLGFSRPSLDGNSWECGGGPGTAEITVTCANINTVVANTDVPNGDGKAACASGHLLGGGCSVLQNRSPFSTSTVTGAGTQWHCKSSLPNGGTMQPISIRTICAANQLAVFQAPHGGANWHNGEVRARPCGATQKVLGGGCQVLDGIFTAGWNFFNQNSNTDFGANTSPSYECGAFGTHKTTIGICMDNTLNLGDF